jgi:excinuclease UvrABC ATPase subunit
MDEIRKVFAATPEAKARGYEAGRFSMNTKGGRCEACAGYGTRKVEMHFLPDVWVKCKECEGKRFNRQTLEVNYKGKTLRMCWIWMCRKRWISSLPSRRSTASCKPCTTLGWIT